jgi:ABC-type amino acid transport substrate-binding protein
MAGGAVKEYLSVRFPDMKIIEVEDNEEAIALLQKGLLDGVVMDEGSADFLTKRSIVELRKANINFDYPYSFGYTKDNHMLGSIMTKAITSISSKDKQTLNKKWIEVKK